MIASSLSKRVLAGKALSVFYSMFGGVCTGSLCAHVSDFALDEVLSGALAKDDVLLIGFFATPYVGFVAVFIFYKYFGQNQTLMNPTFVHSLIAMKFRKLPTSGRLKVFEQQVKSCRHLKETRVNFWRDWITTTGFAVIA